MSYLGSLPYPGKPSVHARCMPWLPGYPIPNQEAYLLLLHGNFVALLYLNFYGWQDGSDSHLGFQVFHIHEQVCSRAIVMQRQILILASDS